MLAFFTLSYFQKQLPAETFNSPDEAANYWFAKEVQKTDLPLFFDGRNIKSQGLVGMRSTRAMGEKTVPGSFLGWPIAAGYFGKIFGADNIIYLTPILLALAFIAFWDLIYRTVRKKFIAWLITALALLAPPTLFFGSHGMFHNGAFLAFIIFGLWAAVVATEKKNLGLYFLYGLFFGGALFFRTNEIVWAGPVFFALSLTTAIIYQKKTRVEKLALANDKPKYAKRSLKSKIFLILPYLLPWLGFLLPFALIFKINYELYGAIFSFGNYVPDLATAIATQPLTLLQKLLMPFGLHPTIIREVFADYFVVMLWPLSLLLWWACLGCLLYWPRLSKIWRGAFVAYVLVFLWLIMLYGSWEFYDHPLLKLQTIGTSYVRYWWPIWILGLPFLAKVWSLWSDKEARFMPIKRAAGAWILLCSAVVFYAPWAILTAFSSQPEGLLTSLPIYAQDIAVREKIMATTAKEAVILAHTMDKVIWPSRQVIYNLPTPQTKKIVAQLLAQKIKIYELQMSYSEKLREYINDNEYAPNGYILGSALWTEHGWSLYQFELVK
ncbi:MAG: hypothetical protein UV05_C0006G0011 [candidate division CPR1 bacterium GW2011_GWA2_42_17]|uniref:Glycosyltransferase RgtA/B/C/D-like domain-containing protein n=1 Tax=candidate division CPR1 bacterium GW2011_GWA2_42_17 TaxID=1618341 RepID=A0A0G0Z6W0_9BACT|nr:MAG: hypothetical protein UV05_C0006G0011 [candidate division CPR1 bacterium GW2011_GWA2_42_17]